MEREAETVPGLEDAPDQANPTGESVPKGSRLWQLLATRNPDALHRSSDTEGPA
jgi:hypothetical protein